MYALGFPAREIAERFKAEQGVIEALLTTAQQRTGAYGPAEVTHWAIRHGLVELQSDYQI